MANVKKGLRILSLSVILFVAISVAMVLIPNFIPSEGNEGLEKFVKFYLPITLLVVSFVCYNLDLVGLNFAGRGNNYFKIAWKLKIISLLLTLICIILAIIMAVNQTMIPMIVTINLANDIVVVVIEYVTLIYVIKGCSAVAPQVKHLSKFVGNLHILEALTYISLEILIYVMELKDIPTGFAHPLARTVSILAILFSLIIIVFTIFYVLLILRTTAKVGKAKK